MAIDIDIDPISATLYRVWFRNSILIEATRDPEPAAARALLAKGVTGTAVSFLRGGDMPRLRFDIARLAEMSASADGRFCKFSDPRERLRLREIEDAVADVYLRLMPAS